MAKIAVVGGGIFGCTAAIFLARRGHWVSLFEKNENLLMAASMCNQYRLHVGYHYPRSPETMGMARECTPSFIKEYGDCLQPDYPHYYAIGDFSFRSADQCEEIWAQLGLPFFKVDYEPVLSLFNKSKIEAIYLVHERLINVEALRNLISHRLQELGVDVYLSKTYPNSTSHDVVVNCTYASINNLSNHKKEYQFELCEKPIVRLPHSLRQTSIVVVDGPFMCVDPVNAYMGALGNVEHAIHDRQIGYAPKLMDDKFAPVLNRGVIPASDLNEDISSFDNFIWHGGQYIKDLNDVEHVGSMYTWRTVPPHREHDDARPTTVERHGDVIDVFSGKIGTAVWAAEEVIKLL